MNDWLLFDIVLPTLVDIRFTSGDSLAPSASRSLSVQSIALSRSIAAMEYQYVPSSQRTLSLFPGLDTQ